MRARGARGGLKMASLARPGLFTHSALNLGFAVPVKQSRRRRIAATRARYAVGLSQNESHHVPMPMPMPMPMCQPICRSSSVRSKNCRGAGAGCLLPTVPITHSCSSRACPETGPRRLLRPVPRRLFASPAPAPGTTCCLVTRDPLTVNPTQTAPLRLLPSLIPTRCPRPPATKPITAAIQFLLPPRFTAVPLPATTTVLFASD